MSLSSTNRRFRVVALQKIHQAEKAVVDRIINESAATYDSILVDAQNTKTLIERWDQAAESLLWADFLAREHNRLEAPDHDLFLTIENTLLSGTITDADMLTMADRLDALATILGATQEHADINALTALMRVTFA